MEVIDQLSVALGFATLAGINLYLTTFVTGLAIRFQWVVLAERYEDLRVLGEPAVLLVTGALLITEILADKIPWVDSVWDAFHSLIRPVGGGLLAVSAIGTTRPEFDVIVAVIGAGAASVSHGFKSGTRLAVNHSPEPFSNGIISVTEDVAVIGGLSLMALDPKILAGICVVFLGIAIYSLPKIFRRLRGFYWLLFHNLFGDAPRQGSELALSERELEALGQHLKEEPRLLGAVPVLTGRIKGSAGMRPWLVGRLIAVEGPGQPRLILVAKRWRKYRCMECPAGLRFMRQEGLLGEKLSVYEPGGKFLVNFRLPRGMGPLVRRVVEVMEPTLPSVPAEGPMRLRGVSA